MSQFVYFIPGTDAEAKTDALIDAAGLTSRFEQVHGQRMTVYFKFWPMGPDGKSGLAISAAPCSETFDAETMIVLECAKYHVLYHTSARPGAADLERLVELAGYEIVLADGGKWKIPLLRRWDEVKEAFVAALPSRIMPRIRDGVGRIERCTDVRYAELEKLAMIFEEAIVLGVVWPLQDMFFAAVSLLKVNYRVDEAEIGVLGLLNDDLCLTMIGLSVDLPTLQTYAQRVANEGEIVTGIMEEQANG